MNVSVFVAPYCNVNMCRYNLGPQCRVPIAYRKPTGELEVCFAVWGLQPSFSSPEDRGKYKTINARIETLTTSPLYRLLSVPLVVILLYSIRYLVFFVLLPSFQYFGFVILFIRTLVVVFQTPHRMSGGLFVD
eukprot:GHVQ01002908.1.p1 GENE.GHVQ01002908.1~~GHVQ01002908.1.p1  ORF type:complete len:133 (+),score=6.93 GHVQ01002908.1:95-493(+)